MNCNRRGFPVFTISWSLIKLMSIELVMPSNHLSSLTLTPFSSCPQPLPASGSFPMSQLFASGGQNTGASASVLPMNIPGLISFRIDWFYFLVVQGTLKSLLQQYNLKVSVLQHSAFFMVQHSHPYMITGKTIALTLWTFIGKAISLPFNILSRLSQPSSNGQASFNFIKSYCMFL